MPRRPGSTFVLGMHRRYACRHSGVCCSSGWPIAVDPPAATAIQSGLGSGRLGLVRTALAGSAELVPTTGLPDAADLTLGQDGAGRCVFLEVRGGKLCAVHRQLGMQALPVACRQFPRLAVLEPDGVHVTLSHYCPTAAKLLMEAPANLAVECLAPDAMGVDLQGLDCRDALPPLLRPDALLSWEAHRLWCAHELATLARAELAPEAALRLLQADAEVVRRWRRGEDMEGRIRELGVRNRGAPAEAPLWEPARARALVDAARRAAAAPLGPLAMSPTDAAHARWVAPAWPAAGDVVSRYLGARAHASWVAQQGRGLRSRLTALWTTLSVLREQAARLCEQAQRPLDDQLLLEALQASDLLLVHLIDPQVFAESCAASEEAGVAAPC